MTQGSLLMLWMDENVSQQSNEKLLMKENLQLLGETTTKLARTVSTWGMLKSKSYRTDRRTFRLRFRWEC